MIAEFDPVQTSGDELRRSYVESGYVLVTGLVDKVARAEITRELRRINRGDYSRTPIEGVTWRHEIEPVDWPEEDERLLGRHMYLGQPHVYSAVVRDAMTHPGICRVLDHVVGAHVPFWNGAYKCMQSMFVVKPPGGSGSPWHQDEHPIPTRDRSLTGVWIALTDATVANGCLWILPDSHKSGVIYERYAHDLPDVDSNPSRARLRRDRRHPDRDDRRQRPVLQRLPAAQLAQEPERQLPPRPHLPLLQRVDVADLGRRAELPRRGAGARGGSLCRSGLHHAAALGAGAIALPSGVRDRWEALGGRLRRRNGRAMSTCGAVFAAAAGNPGAAGPADRVPRQRAAPRRRPHGRRERPPARAPWC